jgi:hypothetical protein
MSKLNKRQNDLILELYNEHLESCYIKNLHKINAALDLAYEYSDMFDCERVGFDGVRSVYNFKIKKLGYIPDFLRECKYMNESRTDIAIKMTNKIIHQYLTLKRPSKSELELRIDLSMLNEGKEHFKDNFNMTVKIEAVKETIKQRLLNGI